MFEKQQHKLKLALGKLSGTEGRPIARRNARKRVLGALRALRVIVDDGFPAIVSRVGVKRLTLKGREVRLKNAGWVPASRTTDFLADCAVAGVRIKEVAGTPFVPAWAKFVWNDAANNSSADEVSALRAARKNPKLRNAALAKAALLKE